MTLTYTPQRSDDTLEYAADGDVLTVTYTRHGEEVQDVFDFTGTPDGALDVNSIETVLPIRPVLEATRTNGELTVRVLRWYGRDEKHLYENGGN